MSLFCYKKLAKPIRLGEVFKKARQSQGLSLPSASRVTHIPEKYLEAIEEGNFQNLPKAKVYRLSYLREYAKILELQEKLLEKQFVKEGGLLGIEEKISPAKKIKKINICSLSIVVKNLALTACVILFFGYLFFQVKGILEPPTLDVFSPIEGSVLSEASINIQGETEKECLLTINGESVRIDETGKFDSKINLTSGVNTLVISATKKHGKTTTITRHLVVKNNANSLTLNQGIAPY